MTEHDKQLKNARDAVAVIGMACRFPGAADADEFWQNLVDAKISIGEIPADRWDWRDYWGDPETEPNKIDCKWGGFITDVDKFDASFFNVSPREAKWMDPQQRIMLELAWACFEDAGYAPSSFRKSDAGVFLGICNYDYKELLDRCSHPIEGYFLTGTATTIVPNRVSQFFDFRGPSVAIDTACSSSLFSVDAALTALRSGSCSVALAGGVNLLCSPERYIPFSRLGMMSKDGLCKTFDHRADGYVRGEGAGWVLLKPLAQAERDGDRILAVIKHCETNHGGAVRSLTSPNMYAQSRLVLDAYSKAGIAPETVGYIEAHGTGTPLGDPIEFNGLNRAFGNLYKEVGCNEPPQASCGLGSVKTNIGHLEGAAGIAGLIKLLLCLQHQQLPALANFEQANPRLKVDGSPFYLIDKLSVWPAPNPKDGQQLPRRAGVSSFGFGGANAHLIVEEYLPHKQTVQSQENTGPVLIALSVKRPQHLNNAVKNLSHYLETHTPNLIDLAYTLQLGRDAMAERVAWVVNDLTELKTQLKVFLKNADLAPSCYRSGGPDVQLDLDSVLQSGDLNKLAEAWVAGETVPWERLYTVRPQRLSLPTYPFARDRHWMESVNEKASDTKIQQSTASLAFPTSQESRKGKVVLLPVEHFQTVHEAGVFHHLTIHDRGDCVWEIQLKAPGVYSTALMDELLRALDEVKSKDNAKVVLLCGEDQVFLNGSARESQQFLARKMDSTLAEFPLPLLAVIKGQASGPGLLLAVCADFMVLAKDAQLQFDQTDAASLPDESIRDLFKRRFGSKLGESLCQSSQLDSADWLIGGVPVLPQSNIDACAMDTAKQLASCPRESLRMLKQHFVRAMVEAKDEVSQSDMDWDQPLATEVNQDLGRAISLRSSTVTMQAYPNGTALITLNDESTGNGFSDDLVQGVEEAFTHIQHHPEYKVVVLAGSERFFSSGGTKESLLAIQAGELRFTDKPVFGLPLRCELPVIAAMQGRAIGAGWALGMFCDRAIFAEQSHYSSPYMRYGFTPGAGATLIFPARMGWDLARDILFTAREYTGLDLQARGLDTPVLPATEVLPYALRLAAGWCRADRADLIDWKKAHSQSLRDRLESTYAQELAMHEQSFVGQPEVMQRIQQQIPESSIQAPTQKLGADEAPAVVAAQAVDQGAERDEVRGALRELLAAELQTKPSDIGFDTPFAELGLDSISGVTWVRRLNERYELSILATKVYDHPTLNAFSAYVLSELQKQGKLKPSAPVQEIKSEPERATPQKIALVSLKDPLAEVVAVQSKPVAEVETASVGAETMSKPGEPESIAIIGMSGQFPQAPDLQTFWENIATGKDCITEVPPSRWSVEQYFDPDPSAPEKSYSKWMGVLDGADEFDPLFFNISPREAEWMDPQHRLFLQNSWRCIEDACYDPRSLSASRCGVFVGCAPGEYVQLMNRHGLNAQGFTGGAASILASRIAYSLNLQGPCMAIDTACSASLVALANACDSLALGHSDLALAGGVYVMWGPSMHIQTSKAGMLSPQGRCFSFDGRANGFVPGEGVGVVLLKRLKDAQRDGDPIQGVIRGWGVNQDGTTNGITAPNGESQARLIREVYQRHGINPEDIQLLEAHGTGTQLGDPIESEALREAFATFTQKQSYCSLGSVKSNVGHLLSAAGIAGVIKALLALRETKLPPAVHAESCNERVRLENSPFYVNTQCQKWPVEQGRTRYAAVSSFGFSGTNAHVVISEGMAQAHTQPDTAKEWLLVLSAKDEERLRDYARDLQDFISKAKDIRLSDLAYSLQVGREAMTHRLAIVGSGRQQLIELLDAYLAERSAAGCFSARAGAGGMALDDTQEGQEFIRQLAANRRLGKLAQLWVEGCKVHWEMLYQAGQVRRLSGLPTYPFAKESYWLEEPQATAVQQSSVRPFNSKQEPHHQSHKQQSRWLPGLHFLELARSSAEQSTERSIRSLSNMVWSQPVECLDQEKELHTRLLSSDTGLMFQVLSGNDKDGVVHQFGELNLDPSIHDKEALDLESIRSRLRPVARTDWSVPESTDFESVHRGEDEILVRMKLPNIGASPEFDQRQMDAAWEIVRQLEQERDAQAEPVFPYALKQAWFKEAKREDFLLHVVRRDSGQRMGQYDVHFCDLEGNIFTALNEFSVLDLPHLAQVEL